MKVTNKFKKICSHQGNNFTEWFGDMEYPKSGVGATLYSKKLPRSMNDSEILAELKPTEVSIVDIFETLKELDKSTWGIFYCKDGAGVLRAVRVGWHGGGCFVVAVRVENPGSWRDGVQVFSRDSFDTQPLSPSEPKKDIKLEDEK